MKNSDSSPSSLTPMLIIGGLFFLFGFVTWLNGSLIPFLQIACELTHLQAYFVTFAFYLSYTFLALPSSLILRRTGYRKGMALGLFAMVLGALLFIPAAWLRLYSIFLLALFILGAGLTILQTASNPYVVMIGPRETAAVRISIMGILNKGAGFIAPLVFTALVLTDMSRFDEARIASLDAAAKAAELAELSARLILPYLIMAAMLLVLAIFIQYAPLAEPDEEEPAAAAAAGEKSALRFPHVTLGALTLFFYVGVEVIAGDTIGLFGKASGVANFGQLTSYTMAFMIVGYILGLLAIPKLISQQTALKVSAALGVLLAILVLTSSIESSSVANLLYGWTAIPVIPNAVFFVALFGLSNALVWPAVWPLALQDLSKKQSATASALLIMGSAGGALLPLLYGALADTRDSQSAYWVMIPCYLFILFYALKGHKLRPRDFSA